MNKEKLVYVGGSLFTEAQINQRKLEGKLLKEKSINYYNPIENDSINDKSKLPTAEMIFDGDTKRVLESSVIMADIQNQDPGLMMELGIAIGINMAKDLKEDLNKVPYKKIIAHNSDIRIGTAHNYKGHYIPVGQNAYVIGGIEKYGKITNSSKECVNEIEKELK